MPQDDMKRIHDRLKDVDEKLAKLIVAVAGDIEGNIPGHHSQIADNKREIGYLQEKSNRQSWKSALFAGSAGGGLGVIGAKIQIFFDLFK